MHPAYWLTKIDGQDYSLAVRATEVEWGRCAHSSADEEPGVRGTLREARSETWVARVRESFGEAVLVEYLAAVLAALDAGEASGST